MIFKSVIVRTSVCAAIVCAAIGANSANAATVDFTLTQGSKTDSWSLDANSAPYIDNVGGGDFDIYWTGRNSNTIVVFPAGVNYYTYSADYGSDSQTGNVPWFEMADNVYIADFSTDRPFFKTPGTQSFISGIYQLTQYGPYYFGGSGPATLTISGGLAPTAPAPLAGGGALSASAALAALAMTRLRKRKAMVEA